MAHAPATGNLHTRRIAEFVSGLRYPAIPPEVIERIKLLILDSLGCAIYGTELEWSRMLMETLAAVDESRGCGVWGTRQRLSAPHAALVNGTLVQSFELDDVHRVGVLHVGAVTLPAVLAAMEVHPGASGRDFLTAAVAGYEIGPRVGMCMGQEHIGQGWHSGATVGVFSAAAALERLATEPFDILFTDIVMPGGIDGMALARQAQLRYPHLRIMLTSGYAKGLSGEEHLPGKLVNKPYRKKDLILAFHA